MAKNQSFFQRVETEKGTMVKLHGSRHYQVTLEQILYLFLSCPDKELTLKEMQTEFRAEFGFDLPLGSLQSSLTDVLEVKNFLFYYGYKL